MEKGSGSLSPTPQKPFCSEVRDRRHTKENRRQPLEEDCAVAKCTCRGELEKTKTLPKAVIKRDMATSPNLGSKKSPKIVVANLGGINNNSQQSNLALKSPTIKLRTTRSAATSPRMDLKLTSNHQDYLEDSRFANKDNNLDKFIPLKTTQQQQRILRTTKSLSPRPPIRHQHAITVCDENDVMTVKLSPNDSDLDVLNLNKSAANKRCQSEHTSPNVRDENGRFLYDEHTIGRAYTINNRSTGCLDYIPSDPWLRMSDEEDLTINKKESQKSSKPNKFVFPAAKSKSRPNLLEENKNDPWIWQGGGGGGGLEGNNATWRELGKQEMGPVPQKQKRVKKGTMNKNEKPSIIHRSNVQLDVKSSPPTKTIRDNPLFSSSLTVNQNLIQSRHSFSTTPNPKEDELQLNIRRLSEQIRKDYAKVVAESQAVSQKPLIHNYANLKHFKKSIESVENDKKTPEKSDPLTTTTAPVDPSLLETTC